MENKPHRIGEYEGVPVYFDADRTSIGRCMGPVREVNTPGIVYMNWETGKMALPSGEEWVPEKVEYEPKFYLVPTDNIEEAIELIKTHVK